MKKTAVLCAVILLVAAFGAIAQSTASEKSDIFYKLVPLSKVYTHPLGYKLVYLKGNYEMGSIYLPLPWFGKAAGKGIMVYEAAGQPSYFSIFWLNGKFDHVVVHVPADTKSPVWGILDTAADVSAQFKVEEPKLDF